jgi:nicotinamide-nucleotide amidase
MGALTEIAGSSDVIDRGFVTYTNRAKMESLGIPADIIRKGGAVTMQTACAMAKGAVRNSSSNIAVSVTGIAGPGGGTDQKPVGLVHMAVFNKNNDTLIHQKHLFGEIGRSNVREATVVSALELLLLSIASDEP